MNNRNFLDMETEYKCKLTAKEKEIASLKAKLSESLNDRHYSTKMESITGGDENLIREIEALKVKLQELESDCQELTDENLELLLKLKEKKKSSTDGVLSSTSFKSEGNGQESQMDILEENMRKKLLRENENYHNISIQEIESLKSQPGVEVTELNMELGEKWAEMERLRASLLSKEDENGNLLKNLRDLEAKLSVLQNEKGEMEERMEIVTREGDIATKCLDDLRKDIVVLSSSVDSHVSANKILERRSSELASVKQELEIRLSELKQENEELFAHITDLEGQITQLTDERKSTKLELENSKTKVEILQDQVSRLTNDLETQTVGLKQNLQQLHDQWLESQDECDHLKRENLNLQASAESIMHECSSLQQSNGELEGQKSELEGHCSHLEEKLRESHRRFADCSRRVTVLEENICSVLDDSASKEKKLTSDLETLLDENEKQNKRFSLLKQMYLEKMVEVESLQREAGDLTKQLSATQVDRERIASEAVDEVSGLCAVIAKIESELNTSQIESNKRVQGLMGELAASNQNQEILKVDNGRMSKLLTNYISCEENFKTTLSDLESKLTVSEYERQQVMEESTKLRAQFLEIGSLQDEVVALKNELNAIKCEKEKLENSFRLVSEECKELKIEKSSFN
ncbi:HEAVY CHAIN-LIKE PROTEIN putative-RELATED [Salix koriyanagi]|uniref:HEAVY CHAIN-LIKE PROTEIN putative-RELATED n=1 Tax=Salix koriyanagi TaxID=2511006 RepID=A0A9Q0VDW5_9ROSI|nr:HEAVY CHAIN-LIKE PROTEIN putative-RELATED [Salix koriyanagi]